MTKIVCVPGYQIVEKIHASSRTLIYRSSYQQGTDADPA
jgi:hypothetical protein